MSEVNNSPSAKRGKEDWQAFAREMRANTKAGRAVPLPAELAAALDDEAQFVILGRQAAVWVHLYRVEHDNVGPTWRELTAAIHPECTTTCGAAAPELDSDGIRRAHTELLMKRLTTGGWLVAGSKTRSLRPGPAAEKTPAP